MRKIIMVIFISQLFLYSCESDAQKLKKQDNVLLAKEVRITSSVDIYNQTNPDWTLSLKREELFKKTFEKVLSNKVPVYGASPVDFEDLDNKTPYPIEKMNEKMNWINNKQDYSELKEIWFYENWDFSPDNFKFTKKVIGWTPIRLFDIEGKLARKRMFFVYPQLESKGKEIAKSMFYELPWGNESPIINVGFDKLAFFKFIVAGIKSGQIDAYDPIYLIDKSKRKFSLEQLEKYIGEKLNAGLINFYLSSILFEEDWYFNESTLGIQKDVKSIAFVQERYDSNTDLFSKKILFFIFPKE